MRSLSCVEPLVFRYFYFSYTKSRTKSEHSSRPLSRLIVDDIDTDSGFYMSSHKKKNASFSNPIDVLLHNTLQICYANGKLYLLPTCRL